GLAVEKPNDLTYQRDLSVAYTEVGDVLMAQGNLAETLKSFRDGFAIVDRLAGANSSNIIWQVDLSVSYNKIGEVLLEQMNVSEALQSFPDGFAIIENVAKAN